MSSSSSSTTTPDSKGPPAWFVLVTAVFTLVVLVMALAETTLWTHYLIDRGEVLCLGGLGFALFAGARLHRSGRLAASLPLFVPWLLYPVVTQGDQIIDNMTIQSMRLFAHAVLLLLFLAPIAVATVGARFLAGVSSLAPVVVAVLLVEIWIAHRYLGAIMVSCLVAALALYLCYWLARRRLGRRGERLAAGLGRHAALGALLSGIVLSFGLYLGYKHRPGAYQGSPHHLNDPSREGDLYPFDAIPVPETGSAAPLPPRTRSEARAVLSSYGEALERLLAGYYVLDRNYNYAFHNALFLRSTPVLEGFREKGLLDIARARATAGAARESARELEPSLSCEHPLGALVLEVERFAEFVFTRAATLESMSARFERTEAGLQHATHLYEGEGKALGLWLAELRAKHRGVVDEPDYRDVAGPFVEAAARIQAKYADRIVGF